jgi:hypothetical protein
MKRKKLYANYMRVSRSARRWSANPLLRRYELQFSPVFWKWRNRWLAVRFRLHKTIYSGQVIARDALDSTSIFFLMAKTAFRQVILALLLLCMLGLCDKLLWSPRLLHLLAHHVRGMIAVVTWLRVNPTRVSIPVGARGTLAEISGLFLGLYFTAISVVAGQNYATVPTGVLNALVREAS